MASKPLTVTKSDASGMTGLPVRTIEQKIRQGELEAKRVGRRILIDFGSLERLVLRGKPHHDSE